MVIGEGVVLVLALSSAVQEPLAPEDAQPGRDRGQGVSGEAGQLRDAPLFRAQELEKTQSARIPRSAEDGRCSLEHPVRRSRWGGHGVVVAVRVLAH